MLLALKEERRSRERIYGGKFEVNIGMRFREMNSIHTLDLGF